MDVAAAGFEELLRFSGKGCRRGKPSRRLISELSDELGLKADVASKWRGDQASRAAGAIAASARAIASSGTKSVAVHLAICDDLRDVPAQSLRFASKRAKCKPGRRRIDNPLRLPCRDDLSGMTAR